MKKIYIESAGCELRLIDANKLHNYFLVNGHKIVQHAYDADIIIIVTCAAFNETAELNIEKIKQLQKNNAELIVAGCLPSIEEKKLLKVFKGKIIHTSDLDKNPDKIDNIFPDNKIKFKDIKDPNISAPCYIEKKKNYLMRNICRQIRGLEYIYINIENYVLKNIYGKNSLLYRFTNSEKVYQIRISWGCMSNCTYCSIKKAIGNYHSKSLKECVLEFKKGLYEGHKNFLINADDVSVYGLDIGSSLPELLDEITKNPGEYGISILHLNPRWAVKYVDDLQKILKRNKIVSLGIPIQSGSRRILKLMNRYYDVQNMKDAFIKIRNSSPDLLLTTTYIIGFPSETRDDFKETLNFIFDTNFNSGLIYKFSLKKGTAAEDIQPKISTNELSFRMDYAKRFLVKNGYKVFYSKKKNSIIFDRKK